MAAAPIHARVAPGFEVAHPHPPASNFKCATCTQLACGEPSSIPLAPRKLTVAPARSPGAALSCATTTICTLSPTPTSGARTAPGSAVSAPAGPLAPTTTSPSGDTSNRAPCNGTVPRFATVARSVSAEPGAALPSKARVSSADSPACSTVSVTWTGADARVPSVTR